MFYVHVTYFINHKINLVLFTHLANAVANKPDPLHFEFSPGAVT